MIRQSSRFSLEKDEVDAPRWTREKDDFSWLVLLLRVGAQPHNRARTSPSRWTEGSETGAANKRLRTIMSMVYLAILILAMIVPLIFFRR